MNIRLAIAFVTAGFLALAAPAAYADHNNPEDFENYSNGTALGDEADWEVLYGTEQSFVRDALSGSPTGNNAVTSVGGSSVNGALPTFTSAEVGNNQLIFQARLIPGSSANSAAVNVGQVNDPENPGPGAYFYQLKYLAGVNWRAYNNSADTNWQQDEWAVGADVYDAIVRLTMTFGNTDTIVPSISFDDGVSFTDSLTTDTFTEAELDARGAWHVILQNAGGGSYFDDIHMYITPEPSTLALLVLGGLTVLIRRRRA